MGPRILGNTMLNSNNAIPANNPGSKLLTKNLFGMFNKFKSSGNNCSECGGTGYSECLKCHTGCWRCDYTCLTECIYCNGTGESGNRMFNGGQHVVF